MFKSPNSSRPFGGKRLISISAIAALALSGLALGAVSTGASAATPVTTKVVYGGAITAETSSYPVDGWFVGANSNPSAAATVTGTTLSLTPATQLLYKLPSPEHDLGAFISRGFSSNVTSAGDETFQIAISWEGGFTTFRSAVGTTATGVVTAKVGDQWISSHSVTGAASSVPTNDTLGNLISDLTTKSGGSYDINAVGIFGGRGPDTLRTAPTTVSSVQFDNTKYTFAQNLTVAKATKTSTVQLDSIGLATSEWPSNQWFFGQNAETSPSGSVVGGNLVLVSNDAAGTQLLHQFSSANRPDSITSFIESGLAFTVASGGTASFQIPLTYGVDNTAVTLSSAALGTGTNDVSYSTQFSSSDAIGTSVDADTLYPLSTIVAAIEESAGSTSILGFGVEATKLTTPAIASVQAAGTKYTFVDTKTLSFNSVSFSGTAQVNATVTAASDLNGPGTGVEVTYKWLASSKTVGTGETFQIPASLSGKKLSVEATASGTGFKSGSATSASQTVAAADYDSTSATISDTTPVVGDTLTVTATSSPVATKYTYQWYRGSSKISSATKTTYKVVVADLGSALSVKVTPTKTGYSSTSFASDGTTPVGVGSFTLTNPELTGTVTTGKTLTASATSSLSGVSKVYEFSIDGSDGAILQIGTSSKFTVPSYLNDGAVTVTIIAYAPGYTSQTATATDGGA